MDLNQVLTSKIKEFFPEGKEKNNEWWTLNPLRNDSSPDSFSIDLRTGKYFDFASSDKGNMISLIKKIKGVSTEELAKQYGVSFQRENNFHHFQFGYPTVIYLYHTINGSIVGYICRFQTKDGKIIRPYSDGKWGNSGFPRPYPLYNIHKLNKDKKVLIVEGEKAADKAQSILGEEYLVTTWPFGAAAVEKADWSMLSQCNEIFLWPDNDVPGRDAAQSLKKILGNRLRIVNIQPLKLPESWDLGDCDDNWGKNTLTTILESCSADIDPVNKIDYKPHPALEKHINYASILPEFINETNETTVTMDTGGNIIGHSVSSVILFCIDYYNAGKDIHQSNKIALLAMDGKIKNRQYKQIKENGEKKFVIIEEPVYLNDGNYSKLIDFYNQSIIDYKINCLKEKLKYNGSSYEKTKKIFTALSKYFTDEAEVAAVILIHFIVQVKLKLNNRHNEIQLHMAPVFCSTKQQNGKSTFMRKFCSPFEDFYSEKQPMQIVDERHWKEVCSKFINGTDEMDKVTGSTASTWKGMITSDTLSARILGRNLDAVLKNNTTYICTAQTDNLGEKIIDETGNRRFGAIIVKSFIDISMSGDDNEILKGLFNKKTDYVFPRPAETFFNFD